MERKPSNDLFGGAYRVGWRFYSDDFAVVRISKHDFLAFQASQLHQADNIRSQASYYAAQMCRQSLGQK
jgi:hypothetical protein